MTKQLIITFLLITLIVVLFHGIYMIYDVFYSSYFDQTEYNQIAIIGNQRMPSKSELLFYGFRDLKVLLFSSLISFVIVSSIKLIKTEKNKS